MKNFEVGVKVTQSKTRCFNKKKPRVRHQRFDIHTKWYFGVLPLKNRKHPKLPRLDWVGVDLVGLRRDYPKCFRKRKDKSEVSK